MTLMRTVLVLGLAAALAGNALADKKGKKKEHAVRGIVVAVEKDKDKDSGTVTIKIRKKKAAPEAADVERTFKVSEATKFEKLIVSGKGQKERKPAAFADVHKGEHVIVTAGPREAAVPEKVAIVTHTKAKDGPTSK